MNERIAANQGQVQRLEAINHLENAIDQRLSRAII